MSYNVTITYELNPPAGTPSAGLEPSQTLSYPVFDTASGKGEIGKFYDALRGAIVQAKDAIGEDLTAWRDAVGILEQSKEPGKSKKEDEDEEGGDGDEDESEE